MFLVISNSANIFPILIYLDLGVGESGFKIYNYSLNPGFTKKDCTFSLDSAIIILYL